MRLQFKIVGARRGPAPSPSPFASVTDWMLPSTPLKRWAFLKHNCAKTLQWAARLQLHWKDALFKLASVMDTSIPIWSASTTAYGYVCSMAWTTGIFPGWTGYFPREKSGELEGKILLAHYLLRLVAESQATWVLFLMNAETLCSTSVILRGTEPVSASQCSL